MSVFADFFLMSHIFLILYVSSYFFVYWALQMIHCRDNGVLSSTNGCEFCSGRQFNYYKAP